MGGIRARINRLARQIGNRDQVRTVFVTTHHYSPKIEHHVGWVALGVPWHEDYLHDADPIDDLTPEQRALIGPDDKVVCICLPPKGQDEAVDILGLSRSTG